MTLRRLHSYLAHIPTIRAGEKLDAAACAAVPYMESESAEAMLNEWREELGLEPAGLDTISFDEFKEEIKRPMA